MTHIGKTEGDDTGEGRKRREKDLGSGEWVLLEDFCGVAEKDKPTMV